MEHKGHNTYIYLLWKLLLAFGSLLAMQVLFFVANSHIFRPDSFGEWMGIFGGNFVFGMATVCTVLLPYIILMLLPVKVRWKKWYRIIAETLYILPWLVVLVAKGADSAYFQYTYRMLSNEIFTYLGNSGPMDKLIPHFMVNYWYAFVFGILIIIAFLILNFRIRLSKRNPYTAIANEWTGFGVGLLVAWFFLRGGFGGFIQLTDAATFCQPKNIPVVSNSGYNILRTLFQPQLESHEYMSQLEADRLFSPEFRGVGSPVADTLVVDTLPKQPKNIVLIIVESFGQEYSGTYNRQADADTRTPFLDSLARFCTIYQGRANGKRSIEGITAILTGIPTLMNVPFVNCTYRNDSIAGIPTVLNRHGYHTAFFHGSHNGVMDFDKVCARIGFHEYLGLNEFKADSRSRNEDFDNVWGVYDEPFLQYVVRHTSTFKEPFLTTVFTVTSHDPFPLPEQYEGRFLEGKHPILKCVEYMDNSLRHFFNEARKQPWFDNTLFIITADHSGPGLSPEYLDYDGSYRIPMIVYDPQNPVGHVDQRIVQQTDLLPSLIDRLEFDDQVVAFGKSIKQQPQGWQVYFGNDYFCMVSNNPDDPAKHDITVLCGRHAFGSPKNVRFLKAVVQQYFTRVMNNKLLAQ